VSALPGKNEIEGEADVSFSLIFKRLSNACILWG
jgi:hypothetical protein